MKFAGILNETGPTLNENAFHSFVVAKQIFLWQLPQLHHAIGSYQSRRRSSFFIWQVGGSLGLLQERFRLSEPGSERPQDR